MRPATWLNGAGRAGYSLTMISADFGHLCHMLDKAGYGPS
jgi:hypothetical protein